MKITIESENEAEDKFLKPFEVYEHVEVFALAGAGALGVVRRAVGPHVVVLDHLAGYMKHIEAEYAMFVARTAAAAAAVLTTPDKGGSDDDR